MYARSPEVVREASAAGERSALIAKACVGVCLVEKTEDVGFPLLGINRLATIKVIARVLILSQMAVNETAR